MAAAVVLSIALGPTIGGLLFDGIGYQATFVASAVSLPAASALACLTARIARANAA